jgi:hypothetical protein
MLDEEGSLAGRETSPMATPAAGEAIGTPASRRANVPPQTEAMEEEPRMGKEHWKLSQCSLAEYDTSINEIPQKCLTLNK